MRLVRREQGLLRQPPVPNAPTVAVVLGGEAGGPDVGLVRVHVPPGAGMAAHRHNGSDVILTPVAGRVAVSAGGETLEVEVGDSVLVCKGEEVSLANPGSVDAEVIVAAGPADFVAAIRSWPSPPRPEAEAEAYRFSRRA